MILLLSLPLPGLTFLKPDLAPPPLQNYTLEDYNLQPQNWAITQDSSGQLIFANQGGILSYDGRNWQQIPLPNTSAYAVLALKDELIAAGQDSIGYLRRTDQGLLAYHALSDTPALGRVYRLHRLGEQAVVQSQKGFFLLAGQRLQPWLPEFDIRRVFTSQNDAFFQTQNGRLYRCRSGEPEALAALDPRQALITWVTALKGDRLLLATYQHGLYSLENGSVKPFPSALNDYLSQSNIVDGLQLDNGDFALATRLGGLVILDAQGNRRWLINRQSGLRSNTLYCLFMDREHNLWMGLSYGIGKLEIFSPFRFFSASSSVPEMLLSVTATSDLIWAGATNGLFCGSGRDPFIEVPGLSASVWDLLSTPTGVLCASSSGLYLLRSASDITRLSDQAFFVLEAAAGNGDLVYAAAMDAVYTATQTAGHWHLQKINSQAIPQIRSLASISGDVLWCGSESDGLWRLQRHDGRNSWTQTHCGAPERSDKSVRVFSVNREIWLVADGRLMVYDSETGRFQANDRLGPEFSNGGKTVFILAQDNRQNIWACIDNRIECFRAAAPAHWQRQHTPFLRLPQRQVNHIHFSGRTVFFAAINGLSVFEPSPNAPAPEFSCYIKRLRFGIDRFVTPSSYERQIPFSHRDLEITLSAPFFQLEQATAYQCKLEGLDNDWSPWQDNPVIRFAKLPSGRFDLRVRARNVFERLSREDRISFSIAVPWFRHPAAYFAYLLLSGLLVWLIIGWRTARLQAEKKALETIVSSRTTEISRQKNQLAEQAERLQELDQLKSRFFANISHEFRTPLTLISGPVDSLAARINDPAAVRTLRNVQHQADRLLDLVNQLLELARFESGQSELQRRPLDLLCLLKGLLSSFESLAEQKRIQLSFISRLDTLPACLDQDKTERLVINLIGNALKFTPAGGAVSLELKLQEDLIEITVSDNGNGIPQDKLEFIFDRFTRIGLHNALPGSGIGLALAREIVNVHQGRIWAENRPEGGSRFIVQLPWIRPDGAELSSGPVNANFVNVPQTAIPEPPTPIQTALPANRPLLLLVEDNADVSRYIQGILQEEYRLILAGNGEKGLEKARINLPDLIVSDIMMPVMDGWQLCRTLKADVATSHIPVILLTARGGEESQMKGLELGADDYIVKPFRPALLLARIANLIRQRRELQKVLRRHLLTEPQEIAVNSTDERFLAEVAALLETHYSDPLFHVEALQQKLLMGRTTLYRKLLALTGEVPSQFLRSFRLARAAQLLLKGHGNVTEVSLAVGFTNPAYFSECFKQKFGITPSRYTASDRMSDS